MGWADYFFNTEPIVSSKITPKLRFKNLQFSKIWTISISPDFSLEMRFSVQTGDPRKLSFCWKFCLQEGHGIFVYALSSVIHLHLSPKALNWTLFSCIWRWLWPQIPNGGLTVFPCTPWLLELLTKFSWITSEKTVGTVRFIYFSAS